MWLILLIIGIPALIITVVVIAVNANSPEHEPGYAASYRWGHDSAGPNARVVFNSFGWSPATSCSQVFGDSKALGELPDPWNWDAGMAGCKAYIAGN